MVGCGPAGCAAAWTLARSGRTVVLAGERRVGARFGELLPPEAAPLLARLGIAQVPGLPCAGVASAWGSPDLQHQDFLFRPHGSGWLLDREAFDALLYERAVQAGAVAVEGRLVSVDPGWRVRIGDVAVEADLLVDATGRAAAVARHLGAPARRVDRLTAVGTWVESDDPDRTLTVEARPEGWWYTCRVPGSRRVVVFLGDNEDVAGLGAARPSGWLRLLGETTHMPRVGACKELTVVSADSRALHAPGGPGWWAVGDARMSWDPLSSRGLTQALQDGLDCLEPLDLERHRWQVETYREARQVAYRGEGRWPEEAFWRRRFFSVA